MSRGRCTYIATSSRVAPSTSRSVHLVDPVPWVFGDGRRIPIYLYNTHRRRPCQHHRVVGLHPCLRFVCFYSLFICLSSFSLFISLSITFVSRLKCLQHYISNHWVILFQLKLLSFLHIFLPCHYGMNTPKLECGGLGMLGTKRPQSTTSKIQYGQLLLHNDIQLP